jgi:hypothetical protein
MPRIVEKLKFNCTHCGNELQYHASTLMTPINRNYNKKGLFRCKTCEHANSFELIENEFVISKVEYKPKKRRLKQNTEGSKQFCFPVVPKIIKGFSGCLVTGDKLRYI